MDQKEIYDGYGYRAGQSDDGRVLPTGNLITMGSKMGAPLGTSELNMRHCSCDTWMFLIKRMTHFK